MTILEFLRLANVALAALVLTMLLLRLPRWLKAPLRARMWSIGVTGYGWAEAAALDAPTGGRVAAFIAPLAWLAVASFMPDHATDLAAENRILRARLEACERDRFNRPAQEDQP